MGYKDHKKKYELENNIGNITPGNSGTFTGNGVSNRPIRHGLGRKPIFITIKKTGSGEVTEYVGGCHRVHHLNTGGENTWIVNYPTDTHFYLSGAGGNTNGSSYTWVAF